MLHADEAKVMEDRINRLPDETLIVIFEKVSEAKFLLYCSLVSKQFASLIPYTRFITVKQLPNPRFSNDWVKLFLSLRHFIKQFRCIDAIHLKLPLSYPENHFVNWEIEFKNSKVSTQFLILSAKCFDTMKKEEDEEGGCGDNNHVKSDLCLIEKDTFEFFARYFHMITCEKWFPMKGPFFDKDVMIKKLVVTESDGLGKIVARKDGVEEPNVYDQLKWQFWYVPVLPLPNSRGVMKEVNLAVSKAVCGDGDGDGDFGDLVCSADGEKTVLWEAAREIMKQNPIRTSQENIGYPRRKAQD